MRRWLPMLLVLLALPACERAGTPAGTAAGEGQILPAFFIRTAQDERRAFERPPARLLLLNLWAIWCPPCREEMPALQRLADSPAHAGLRVIGLAVEKDRFLLAEFLRKYQIRFPNPRIEKQEAETRLGLREYPLTLLVDAEGRILARLSGAWDWDDAGIRHLLQQLVQGQPVAAEAIREAFRASRRAAGRQAPQS